MPEDLEVGQRLQVKLVDSSDEWYSTRIEDLSEQELVVTVPQKQGEDVPFNPGDLLDWRFPRDDGFYGFQAVVLRRIGTPFPMLIVRRPTSLERIQRRQLFRLDLALPVLYRVVGRPGLAKGTTVDVSGGGLGLVTTEQLALGAELELQFTMPGKYEVKAHGRVVKAGQAKGTEVPARYAHGIQFLGLLPSVQERIVSELFAEQGKRRRREMGNW